MISHFLFVISTHLLYIRLLSRTRAREFGRYKEYNIEGERKKIACWSNWPKQI